MACSTGARVGSQKAISRCLELHLIEMSLTLYQQNHDFLAKVGDPETD
jgi:hypothetical protein